MLMRFCPLLYLLLFLLGFGSGSAVAQTGEAQLLNLPPQASIYVDGQLTPAQDGKLHMAAGQHELQVEGLAADNVVAYRRRVLIEANQTRTIHLICAPVYAVQTLAVSGMPMFPAGPTGPPGSPGSPGAPPDESALKQDDALLVQLFDAELKVQLHDLERRASMIEDRTNETRRAFYWYDSQANSLPTDSLPTGPSGEPGEPGIVGTPGNVLIVQDEAGQSLLPQILAQLGITGTAVTLQELEVRAYRRPPPLQTSAVWALPLTVRTSAFSEHLAKLRQTEMRALSSALAGMRETPGGPEGDKGPDGPRGPAWQPAAGEAVKPLRLSKAQTQQIIVALTADKGLQQRVAALQRQEHYLAIAVAAREQQE